MTKTTDRRLRRRHTVGTHLMVTLAGQRYAARCLDASMNGAQLAVHDHGTLDRAQLPNQLGTLELGHTLGAERIKITSTFEVVRVDPGDPAPMPTVLGVRLVEMDSDSSLHLYNLLRYQDPRGE